MRSQFEYVTLDTIISKFHRDTKDTSISEMDLIEWVGEALSFMKVPQIQQESVAFIEVSNYEVDLPKGFHTVLQIARNNSWKPQDEDSCEMSPEKTLEELLEGTEDYDVNLEHPYNQLGYPVPLDSDGSPITDYNVSYYRPFYDLQYEYAPWTGSTHYQQNYTPVRLSNNNFFNSLVCREKDTPYESCRDEYTIVGTTMRKLRFSFREGYIALSYLKNATDPLTGYPLVPDNQSFISAATYYIKWKIAEAHQWSGRSGFAGLAEDSERKWKHYCRQAKNYAKMPKSLDDFQDLLEQSHHMIDNHNRYYGYFGKLNTQESRRFNDPRGANKLY